jgi:hypothetical protein
LAVRRSDGALFGTACESSRNIERIDPTTGDGTLVGTPDDDVVDLAFTIAPQGLRAPALSSAALAALAACFTIAGVVLLGRRRSHPRSLSARG